MSSYLIISFGTSENVIRYVRTLAGTSEWYHTAQSFIRYLRTSFLNQVYKTLKSSLHTKETSQIPSYFRAYKTVHLDLCKASSTCLNKTTQRKVTQNTYQLAKADGNGRVRSSTIFTGSRLGRRSNSTLGKMRRMKRSD